MADDPKKSDPTDGDAGEEPMTEAPPAEQDEPRAEAITATGEDDVPGQEGDEGEAVHAPKAKASAVRTPSKKQVQVEPVVTHAAKPAVPIIIGPKELPRPPKRVPLEKRPAMFLAEYSTPGQCLHAAEKLRDSGYKSFDTHTPFPVHGMDAAMGLPDSKVGWLVLCGGLTGVTTAITMIWWMNGVDYPIIIGGKPGFQLPSSVPIMFELTILFSALTAVFGGVFGLNRLPRHHHPIFESERFLDATDDKFFVSVEVDDPKFDEKRTRALLESTHADNVELVLETAPPKKHEEEAH